MHTNSAAFATREAGRDRAAADDRLVKALEDVISKEMIRRIRRPDRIGVALQDAGRLQSVTHDGQAKV